MRKRTLAQHVGVFVVLTSIATVGSAQSANPRFGKWKLKSEAAAPALNIMTYEPFGDGGMKVTIDAVSGRGVKSQWFYTTMFDGKDEPVTGNTGADTAAVRVINDKINEIIYKKAGKVTQLLINVLSADGMSIVVTYLRTDAQGTTNVTYATYEKQS
jgi:hypothetical protein